MRPFRTIGVAGLVLFIALLSPLRPFTNPTKFNYMQLPESNFDLIGLSQDFLYGVRSADPQPTIEKLSKVSVAELLNGLKTDREKMVFWTNLYNGWFQVLAKDKEVNKQEIFSVRKIPFSDRNFTLDEIEHGILRKYRWKYSKGYMASWFTPGIIKDLSVSKMDYRVHFALNCGAKSCPPILFYTLDNLDKQLNLAKRNFIQSETIIDPEKKLIKTSKIFDWFSGDFGGKKGLRIIIGEVFSQDLTDYSIAYQSYDWSSKPAYYGE